MTATLLLGAGSAGLDRQVRSGKTADVGEVTREFEALLMANLLKTMRSTSEGWLGTGEDQAGTLMMEVAEQELARMLAARGGLGLSEQMAPQLAREKSRDSAGGEHLVKTVDKNTSHGK